MHPNAELAKELERCVATSDASLSNSGLRKGLLIGNGSTFSLTPKGEDFVAKWGKPFVPKPIVAKPVAVAAPQPVASSRVHLAHQHEYRSGIGSERQNNGSFNNRLSGNGHGDSRQVQFGRRPQHPSDRRSQAQQGNRYGS